MREWVTRCSATAHHARTPVLPLNLALRYRREALKRVPGGVAADGPFATASWESYHEMTIEGDNSPSCSTTKAGGCCRAADSGATPPAARAEEQTQEIELQLDH